MKVSDIPEATEGGPCWLESAEVFNTLVRAVNAFDKLSAAPGSGLVVRDADGAKVIDAAEE